MAESGISYQIQKNFEKMKLINDNKKYVGNYDHIESHLDTAKDGKLRFRFMIHEEYSSLVKIQYFSFFQSLH